MNLHNASTIGHSRKASRRQPISIAILIVVLLGLGAAIAYRVAEPGSHAKPAATTAETNVAPAAPAAAVANSQPGMDFFLVDSQDQANSVQAALADAGVIAAGVSSESIAPSGVPSNQVLVAGTSDEQAAAQQTIKDEIDYRRGNGLAPVHVVDLRPSAGGDPPPCIGPRVESAC